MSYEKIFFKKRATPEFITFFVTNKCCLKCQHCFFWKELNNNVTELNLSEIKKIAQNINKFTYLALTGGEPYLREDLLDIVCAFSNKIKNLSISTNGYLTNKTIATTKEMLKKNNRINITIIVSIDGIKEKHDEIRGVKGSFDKAVETIIQLNNLKEKYSNLNVGISITYMKQNQNEIFKIYNYALKLKPDSISIALVRGDARNPISKEVNINNYRKIYQQMDKDFMSGKLPGYSGFFISDFVIAMRMLLWRLTLKIYHKKRYISPCYAGMLSGIIYANGDVFPCELLNKKVGNIKDFNYNFKKLWLSEKAKEINKFIKNSKCFCIHDCNLICNILFNPRHIFKLLPIILKLNVFRRL